MRCSCNVAQELSAKNGTRKTKEYATFLSVPTTEVSQGSLAASVQLDASSFRLTMIFTKRALGSEAATNAAATSYKKNTASMCGTALTYLVA
jgi:acyl CoA:acetate/3-ketoacid CoA transferase alpha subunit